MNELNKVDRSWALFFSRQVLGFIFFMAGMYKVFQMGALEHARNLFVEPYSGTFIPIWLLWLTGTAVPVIELLAGALLIVGWRRREALIFLGFVLVLVTFGHLLKEPFYEFHTHVIPRLALLLFILVFSQEEDRLSIDYLLKHRVKSVA